MSYGNKKQYTTSNGIKIRIFEPKRFLKRAADISAKAAIITVAAVWLSGGVFQSAADTSNPAETNIENREVSNAENYIEDSGAYDEIPTDSDNSDGQDANEIEDMSEDGFLNPALGTLTSNFGTRWGRLHSGIDIGADTGREIYAAKSGRVIFSGVADGYGNYVKIDHGNGIQTAYGHCSALAVNEGDEVKKGQIIAYVGSTGNSTGPHLHFEIKIDGEFKNPLDYVVY